jgi:hypothetical protein
LRPVVLALATGAMIAMGLARPDVCCPKEPPPLRVATFNIETFPKNPGQIEGAFDEIARLGVGALAVQEIFDPGVFAEAANRRLGPSWRFVHTETMPPGSRYSVHVGVLFDGEQLELVSETVHGETRLDGRHKPTFEVRLRPKGGGEIVQIFVVHFKSGTDGRAVRERQFEALGDLLLAARRPDERTMVMGDFNTTELDDRDDLALLSARTGLQWNTEALECSAFWDRRDDCATSRLDHVLSWSRATTVVASGACLDGCEIRDRCPLYSDEVSDHCPVTVSW